MNRARAALVLTAIVGLSARCGSSPSTTACDHDGCVVPLTAPEVNAVCGPSLHARMTDCPGVTVRSGTCGDTLTHLELMSVAATSDCYYTTSSGKLVAAILRSDSGFTKNAGDVPAGACAATTQVCDHTPVP